MALNSYELHRLDELIGTLKKLTKSIEKVSLSIDESTKALKEISEKTINSKGE